MEKKMKIILKSWGAFILGMFLLTIIDLIMGTEITEMVGLKNMIIAALMVIIANFQFLHDAIKNKGDKDVA